MCKIIRSECWRQVRFYRDCLRVSCGRFLTGHHRDRAYRQLYYQSELATESLWNRVRPLLPRRSRRSGPAGTFINMGDTPIPEKVQQTLRLGPRFSLEPSLRGAEKVAFARNVSAHVPEDERCRCTSECIAVLVRGSHVLRQGSSSPAATEGRLSESSDSSYSCVLSAVPEPRVSEPVGSSSHIPSLLLRKGAIETHRREGEEEDKRHGRARALDSGFSSSHRPRNTRTKDRPQRTDEDEAQCEPMAVRWDIAI
ncbi:hypothetical protein HPB51_025534 [Rhipicephalus microplus]|uniref:Uncharacterized protein n=1 Tax=Rhipicephalus microplus TaxID=6941 RepID=A0A9J6F8J9_RHIMP|nr:hypothetical protein HPB51_025534 [Rhipicephalus microplus]